MIHDARELPPGHEIEADLCIVGAGAAGLTLATRLGRENGRGLSICLLESGGLAPDNAYQELYAGTYSGDATQLGDDYLRGSRVRAFGGTTTIWGGYCRPLEPMDFAKRDWVADSGWPFERAHLEPYYDAAADFLKMPRFSAEDARTGKLPFHFNGTDTTERVFQFRNTPFAQAYGEPLRESRRVSIYLHASAVELESNPSGNAVTSLRVANLAGRDARVRAKTWVLATGGIENARLLLASDAVHPSGVGNQHDKVGRYFMEHAIVQHGLGPALLWRGNLMEAYFLQKGPGGIPRCQFVFATEPLCRREGLLNASISFEAPIDGKDLSMFDRAAMAAARRIDGVRTANDPDSRPHLRRPIAVSETAPNAASRVTLTRERDALGMRRVHLEWRLSGREAETLHRFSTVISGHLGAKRLGRMKVGAKPAELPALLSPAIHHHMGTTRMHDDPLRGVVDANCKVHGVENLYVAGSSVFPTSGAANPTFTIVALALRLAEHLSRRLGAGA